MRFNKTFTRVVAALCSLSTAVGPALAAVPVYKVYIPDLKVSGDPTVKHTTLIETSYSQLEHTAYSGDTVPDLQRPLTIRNKGTAPVPLQISFSSPAYQVKHTDCPPTLPVAGSCVVDIAYTAPPLSTPFGTTEASLFVNKGATTEEEVLLHANLTNPLALAANVPLAPLVGSPYTPYNFSSNFTFKDLGVFEPLKLSWALSGPVPAGMTLYQGTLQGTPTSANPASFALTATYEGNSVQQTYTITPRQAGSLVAPDLTILSDTPLNTTATKTISIQNTGTVALNISNPDTSNALTTVFLTNDTCSGKNIAAGQTCTIDVNHHPLQAEVVSNSILTWTANPSESGVIPTSVASTLTAQVQASTTNPLQFTAVPALLPSIAGVYYELDLNTLLANPNAVTSAPSNITAQSLTPVAPITPVSWTATQIPTGMSINGSVLSGYTTSAGVQTIKLKATSNGVVIEKQLPLTVQTATIALSMSAATLNGYAKHLPLQSTLTVSNTGQAPLFFAKELLATTPPQNFSIDWAACHAKVLAPGQSCAATLRYNPLQIESGTFDLIVPFHTASNKATANLRNSLTPYLSTMALELPQKTTTVTYQALSPLAFKPYPDLLNADIGTHYTYSFAGDLLFNAPNFDASSVRWETSINDFNGVHFDPITGALSGTPTSVTMPTSFTVTATLPTGFSASKTYTLQFVKHELQVSTQSLDFGTTYLSASKTLSYIVYNIGNVSETIGDPLLVGAIADSLITTNCPPILAAAASCNVQVEYRPSATGQLAGTYAKFTGAAVPTVQVQGFAAAAVSVAIPPQDLSVGEAFTVNLKNYFTSVISTSSTWAADSLPAGLVLNPTTGVITGTPTSAPASGTSTHNLTISYRSNPLLPLQRLYTPIVFNYKDFSWSISKTNVSFNQGTFEGQPSTGWLNTPQTDVLTVTNTGNQPLVLTNPALAASDLSTVTSFATYSNVSTCNALLAPAATCTITLSYTPTADHATVSVDLPIASDHSTKTVALQFAAKNPLKLPTSDVIVYTGTNAAVQLDPLLKVGAANLSAKSPTNITWTTAGTLPAGLSASAHSLSGLVTSPAGTSTTITLTATYANNTISAPLTIKVQEPILTPAPVSTQTVWLGVQKQITLTFTAPASNTQPTSLGTVSQTSASNASITSTTTHNCSSVAPGATCQATVTVSLPASATDALGTQQIALAFAQTYGTESLTVPVSIPLLVSTPLALQQPANLTLLANHTLTPLDYTTLASYLPNPSFNTDAFTWTMTGLPAGLTFNATNQQISGSPTTAGTTTATLTITYQGITLSRSFTIAVVQPTLTVNPVQGNAPVYLGDTLTETFTFQALNGGNVITIPTLSIPAALGTYSTTCTTGLKSTGYSCTATVVLHPTSSTATSLVANLTMAIEGLTTSAILNHTFPNPLTFPTQETWQLLSGQAQSLENFSTLLTDARTSSAKIAPVTWGISSSTATVAIDAQGQASISAPVGSGSFTVSATKQGATLSRTYAYQASAWPISLTPTVANGYNGYANTNLHSFSVQNTSTTAISLPTSSITLLDSNALDLTTPSLTTDACSTTTLAASASCTFKTGIASKDLNSTFTYTPQIGFLWTPQPTTKPTRQVQFTHTASAVSATLSNPLSMAAIADQVAVIGSPFSVPLASKITNLADTAAVYTWSSTGLPAGLTLGGTGTLTGTAIATPATYPVQITATYQTPQGLTLSATKTFNLEVIKVAVSLANIDFGLVYPNTDTLATSAKVVNNGSTAINLGITTFGPPLFGILSADLGTCGTVAAGSSCGITVNLQPTSTGVMTDLATLPLVYKGISVGSAVAPVTATIISPLSLSTTLPPAYEKTPYSFDLNTLLSHNVDSSPLTGAQWTYGTLPVGWAISAAGILTGTPVAATPLTFPVTATYKGYSVSANLPLTPSLLTMTVAGDLAYGVVYTNTTSAVKTLTLTNTSPVALKVSPTWTTAPSGSVLSLANGCSSVAPAGVCTITATYAPTTSVASYSNILNLGYGVTTPTHSATVALAAAPTNPLTFSSTLSTPVIGLSHTQNYTPNIAINPAVEASINTALITWSVSSGSVDAGLTFNTATGVLTGVATTPVAATYTLTATYKGNSISRTFTHTPRVWQMTSATPAVNFGTVYRTASSTAQTVTLTNTSYLSGSTTPTTASFYPTAGATLTTADPTIVLSANTCSGVVQTGNVWANNATCSFTLTYTPTATSSATLSNSVVIKLGNTSGTPSVITIPLTGAAANPLTLDASDLTTAAIGTPYSASLVSRLTNALGATTGATWTATNLPAGLTLNTSTGVISGTPTTESDTTLTISATLNGNTISAPVLMRIVNLTLTATPQPLDFGTLYAKWNTSDRTLTITNPTAHTLNLAITPPASTSAYLTTVANNCTSLAPAQTCAITYHYAPLTTADTLTTTSLSLTTSYGTLSSTSSIALAANPQAITTPISITPPATRTIVQTVPTTAWDLTSATVFIPNPALSPSLMSWSVTGLPPGLTFDAATRTITGTMNSSSVQGTLPLTLTVSYLGASSSVPFSLIVLPATITASPSPLNFGTIYPGTTNVLTTTFTLPNGGTLSGAPVATLTDFPGSATSTCTAGTKPAGHTCTSTITVSPTSGALGAKSGQVSLSTVGSTGTVSIAAILAAPLTLATQETWGLLGTDAQVLEDFSTLLSDARTGDVSPTTWAISSPTATAISITSAGVATIQLSAAAATTGTFTVNATKNYATVSKTYNYTFSPTFRTVAAPNSLAVQGYTTAIPITYTATKDIKGSSASAILSDLVTTDTTTFTLVSDTCVSANVATSTTCVATVNVKSASANPAAASLTTNRPFQYAPQPTSKPARLITLADNTTWTFALPTPLTFAAIPTQKVYNAVPFSTPLASYVSNSANASATYTWTATGLPTGLSINATTGVVSGTTTVADGSYTATITASILTPNGATLTTSKTATFTVANISLSLSTLDFGTIYPNTTGPTQVLTLTNNGTQTVSISATAFEATTLATFTQTATTCSTNLAPAASCARTYRINPGTNGALTILASVPFSQGATPVGTATTPVTAILLNPLGINNALPAAYDKTPYVANINGLLTHNIDPSPLIGATWATPGLPTGWTLTSAGVLTGTPTNTTPLSFPVSATYKGYTVNGTLTLTPNALTLSATSLALGTVYTNSAPATGTITLTNTSAISLSASAFATNSPSTTTVTANTCTNVAPAATCSFTVSYAPTTAGTYTDTLTIQYGSVSNTHSMTAAITATPTNPLSLAAFSPTDALNVPYSNNLKILLASAAETVDTTLITWSSSGSLPTGLSFNPTTALFSGTATQFTRTDWTLTATYKGNTISRLYSINVRRLQGTLTPATTDLGSLYAQSAPITKTYTFQNTSTYSTGASTSIAMVPSTSAVTITPVDTRLAIANNTCTGTVNSTASCTFDVITTPSASTAPLNSTITLKVGSGTTVTQTLTSPLTATFNNPLTLDTTPLPNALKGTPYSLDINSRLTNANGATTGAVWTVSGLPAGMTFNSTTNVISGTPTVEVDAPITFTATLNGNTGSTTLTLAVLSLDLQMTTSPVSFGTLYARWNTASQTLTLTNTTTRTMSTTMTQPALSYLTVATNTCAATLAASASCSITYDYKPQTTTDTLTSATLTVAKSVLDKSASQTASFSSTLLSQPNPLLLATPANISILQNHPMTAVDYTSNGTLMNGLQVPAGASFVWTLTGLPTGTTFDPTTQILSGTPTIAGTYTATLTYALLDQSKTTTFTITVLPATIASTAPPVNAYPNTPSTSTVTFALPNGGNVTALPVFNLTSIATTGSNTTTATTCTTGLKAAGYTCTATLTTTLNLAVGSVATPLVSLSILGFNSSTFFQTTIINPAALTSNGAWYLFGETTPQVLANFNTFLTDARGDASTPTWTIASTATYATFAIDAAGNVTATPTATGSSAIFTVTATKANSVVASRSYNLIVNSSPLTATTTSTPGYLGYDNANVITTTYTNTSNTPLQLAAAAVAVDPLTTDTLTTTLGSTTCSSTILAINQSCTVSLNAKSLTTASGPVKATYSYAYSPQPLNNPSLRFSNPLTATATATFTNPVSIATIPTQNIYQNIPTSFDLDPYASNVKDASAIYTWTTTALPAGLALNTTTGIISGTPTAATGSYSITVTASHTTALGTVLTASKTFFLNLQKMQVTLSTLDFGTSYPDATTPPTRVLTLTNSGTATASFGSYALDANAVSNMTRTASTCTTIAPAASCTMTFKLLPTTAGVVAANLNLDILAGTTTVYTATTPVAAILIQPLTFTPATLTAYDKTPFSQNVNTALSHYSLGNSLAATWTANSYPAGWAISPTGTITGTPTSLSPLTLSTTGTYSGYSATGSHSITVNPVSISSSGTLAYGSVYTNNGATSQTITLTNTTSTTLASISPAVVTATPTLAIANNTCTNLSPNATCAFDVTYTPTTAGAYSNTVRISYGVASGTHTLDLPLTATAVNPLALTTTTLNPIVGITTSRGFNANLTSALEVINPALITWTSSGAFPAGMTFAPATGIVSGKATTEEATIATLTATYKGNSISRTFTFRTQIYSATPDISAVNFGTVYNNTTSVTQRITLTNTSHYALTTTVSTPPIYSVPAFTTSNAQVFLANNTCTGTLSTTCYFDVMITPTVNQAVSATAVLKLGTSNGIPYTLTLPITATVANPLTLNPATLPIGRTTTAYSSFDFKTLLQVANTSQVNTVWSSTTIPASMALDATTGVLYGTPSAEFNSPITVTATLNGNSISQTYNMQVYSTAITLNNGLGYAAVATNWDQQTRSLTVTNPTTRTLSIAATIPAAISSYFSRNASSTCGTTLVSGATCTLDYTYAPTSTAQSLNGYNLTFTSTTDNGLFSAPITVPITGSSYNPLSLSTIFGDQVFVNVPMTYDLQARNLLPANVDKTGTSWAGSSASVNANGIVSLSPTTATPITFSATATLRGNTTTQSYTITPIATSFTVVPSYASVNFGPVYANSTPMDIPLTLRNPGSYAVDLGPNTAPNFTFSYNTATQPFTVINNTCASISLAPAATCTFTVRYAPTALINAVATTLSVPVYKNGKQMSVATVNLTGSAITPLVAYSSVNQPVYKVPYFWNLYANFASVIEPIAAGASLTFSGTLPPGLAFNASTGVISGTPTSTATGTFTATFSYKGNTISQALTLAPRELLTTMTASAGYDFGWVYNNSGTFYKTFTLTNISTYNAPLQLTSDPITSVPLSTNYLAMTSNTCTGARVLAYGEACSYTLAFNPTDPWNNLAYAQTTVGLPFGYNGTTVDTMNTSVYGGAINPMSFSAIPNQIFSVGIPVSFDMRPYLTVANDNSASGSAMSWWYGGTLPAGLTLNTTTGIVSGTPTTAIANLPFQIAALYKGNAAASNAFTLTVNIPVSYSPPTGSPNFYGSSLNPSSLGSVFVEQSVTAPYVWTFTNTVQITKAPTLQAGTTGLYISWTNCPAVGSTVAAGSSCQANVTLTGNAASMGAFNRTLTLGVGTNGTNYVNNVVYVAGNVLNPLKTYGQETIWSLAPNTNLIQYANGWVYTDQYPTATPVTVALTPLGAYMPVYINGAWITSNSDDSRNTGHGVRLTVTKQTSPPITAISEFTINVRSTSNFYPSVASQSGIYAGYPAQVVNYNVKNNYAIPITPVADANNWKEIDYYYWDAITSSSSTNCLTTLAPTASCSYIRTINPGTAAPGTDSYFGVNRAFSFTPQPSTRPWHSITAYLPAQGGVVAAAAGAPPNHNAPGLFSAQTLGNYPFSVSSYIDRTQPMVYCDYFDGTDPTRYCGWGNIYPSFQPLVLYNAAINSTYTPGQYYTLSAHPQNYMYVDNSGFLRGVANGDYALNLALTLTYNVTLPSGRVFTYSVPFYPIAAYGSTDTGGGSGYNPSTDGPNGDGSGVSGTGGAPGGDTAE